MKYIRFFLISILVVFLLNTCEKDDPAAPIQEENKVYDVTLTDNTVYIDSLLVNSLVRIDTADYRYYFQSSDPTITSLQADDILLIHGTALRRVTAVTRNGNETIVETGYATLNEAILDGEISWNKEIKFTDGVVPVVMMNGQYYDFKSSASDGYEIELPLGDYTYKIKFSFSDTRADVEFEITKGLATNVTAKFTARGFLENFYSNAEMKYVNGKLVKFGQKNPNMKGELTLNLTVAASGRDEIVFNFPVVLLKYPVLIGPIPVTINVKVIFVINCYVPVDGSSQVEVKFSYNSSTGIKYDGTNVSTDASIGDYSMNDNLTQTGASSAIGANFGLGFPRLEIGVFDDLIVPWIHTAFLIGGDFTFTPPCQQARSQFIGACGVDFSFLGFGYSADHTFWQEEKVLLKTGECPE